MSNPKISVIVPVYNVETYLEDALDSIVNQPFLDDIEVLMIDDGSTDNSKYLVEKYAMDYENFHAYHKKNEGLSVTRNYGMDRAKGEYIYFIDSDDYLVFDSLGKLYQVASKYDNDVVTANFFRYNEKIPWSHLICDYVFNSLDDNLYDTKLDDYPNLIWDMPVWNKLYKKEFLDENNIRFYDGRVIFEDNIFSTEVYVKAKSISVLKDGVYCWRMRAPNTSLSQSHDIDRGDELYKMAVMVNDLSQENIENKEVLSKKYLKWLIVDIPFYMSRIKTYQKEDFVYIYEGAYKLVNLIPDEYFSVLNNYYQVFYLMLKNKDWDDLSQLIFNDLERNPNAPLSIDDKYYQMFDFEEDAANAKLTSHASKITSENENLKIKFNYHIPFLEDKDENKLKFVIKNQQYGDIVLDKDNFKGKMLSVPAGLLNAGENLILTQYDLKNSKKECLMETNAHKTFIFDDCIIDVARDKFGYLKIHKKMRGNVDFEIEDIEITENKVQFTGHSNAKLDRILLKDYFNFNTFEYPIEFNDDSFLFEIDYNDFLKSPLKYWELDFKEEYNDISVSKPFKKYDEKYHIIIKNNKNKVRIKFKPYDSVDELNKLDNKVAKLKKKNKRLKKENKSPDSKSSGNNVIGRLKSHLR